MQDKLMDVSQSYFEANRDFQVGPHLSNSNIPYNLHIMRLNPRFPVSDQLGVRI